MTAVAFLSSNLPYSGRKATDSAMFDRVSGAELYESDQKMATIISSLLKELDLLQDQMMTQETLIRQKEKENCHLKAEISRSASLELKNRKKNIDLESKVVKLELQAADFRIQSAGVANELRETKGRYNLLKEAMEVEKRSMLIENGIVKRRLLQSTSRQNKRMATERTGPLTRLPKNLRNDLVEQNKQLNGFIQSTYHCLWQLKETQGLASVPSSFIPPDNQLKEDIFTPVLLTDIDEKLVKLIKSIQQEPILGTDDTFRFHRLGAEKQREIAKLKREIEEVRESYAQATRELERARAGRDVSL